MGTSIRGGPSWAIVEPSWNSTIEWICCCGCTTTSIRSNGMSKSRCASITSSPLLTRVAEFVVMTRPMAKLGWASACSGVTSASSARVRPRNGPPLAVTTRRRTSWARPPRRLWAMALCSESTGTSWSGPAAAFTSGPPMMSDSLLASASTDPAASAARVGRSPIEPVTPLSTTSAPHPAATVAASGPTTTSGADAGWPGVRGGRGERGPHLLDVTVRGRDEGHLELHRLAREQVDVAAGGQRRDREAPGVGGHHLEGLGADRAGGAEDGDGACGHGSIVSASRP